jgi:hypothetical protein
MLCTTPWQIRTESINQSKSVEKSRERVEEEDGKVQRGTYVAASLVVGQRLVAAAAVDEAGWLTTPGIRVFF